MSSLPLHRVLTAATGELWTIGVATLIVARGTLRVLWAARSADRSSADPGVRAAPGDTGVRTGRPPAPRHRDGDPLR